MSAQHLIEVRRLVPENETMECPWCGGVGRIIRLIYNREYPPVETCRECAGEGIVDARDPEHQKKARLHR